MSQLLSFVGSIYYNSEIEQFVQDVGTHELQEVGT